MYIQLFYLLELVSLFVGMILPLLLAIAFFTVMERQIMAAIQRRQGPNVVGFYGLFQAITDGLKLLVKESILSKSSNIIIFIFSPVFTFGLAMAG
jgi:NADH-quinone oxidoreductase subunit H